MTHYWYNEYDSVEVSELVGKTLVDVNTGDEHIRFKTDDGIDFVMHHEQDCCESVYVEDINGDLSDLIGQPIVMAEEVTESGVEDDYGESFTWTFYKIGTVKGVVTIRWYGTSNGYYSEAVDFIRLKEDE